MTVKNIFVYKLFLLNISDFLNFLCVKLATPLKKVTPLFSSNPLSKLRSCQAPPPFENFPQQKGGGGGAHWWACGFFFA